MQRDSHRKYQCEYIEGLLRGADANQYSGMYQGKCRVILTLDVNENNNGATDKEEENVYRTYLT